MSTDTFSGYIWDSAQRGECTSHVISRLLECFTMMGVPKQIKTDNAPNYTLQQLQQFLQQWNIHHSTKIPYNPQGQAIREHANGPLKLFLLKQKGGNATLRARLMRALSH